MSRFSKADIGHYIKIQQASRQAKECCSKSESDRGGRFLFFSQVHVVGSAMNTTGD